MSGTSARSLRKRTWIFGFLHKHTKSHKVHTAHKVCDSGTTHKLDIHPGGCQDFRGQNGGEVPDLIDMVFREQVSTVTEEELRQVLTSTRSGWSINTTLVSVQAFL